MVATDSDLAQYLLMIARGLLDDPEGCYVESHTLLDGGEVYTVLVLFVEGTQLGQVIGKEGRMASSIRMIVKACAKANGYKTLLFVELVQKGTKPNLKKQGGGEK